MTASDKAIHVDGVGKRFDDTWVLRNLAFEVPHGTILGLIGPSGCGKTTTVRMTNGVHAPDEGAITVLGRSPASFTSSERTQIGYLPQAAVLFDKLSLWENLNYHASLNGVRFRRRERLHELLELVDLEGEEFKLVRESSGGMKRRLALAATLVHRPSLLLLDEPTAGIDPILRRRFWDHFRALRDRGQTLVVTTQYVGEAADCDIVGMLANGRLVAIGAPEDLRREAFGGDIIEIALDRPVDKRLLDALGATAGVFKADLVDLRRVRMIVGDGGSALPRLIEHVHDAGHEVTHSEEVVPPYDDVFIELVAKSEAGGSNPAVVVPSPESETAAVPT